MESLARLKVPHTIYRAASYPDLPHTARKRDSETDALGQGDSRVTAG